mmetsp:Transcript_2393/g.3323  ORF Transcript_2393/g.3323 Transcript_2393/m.3323 type:complete len:210 (-) Transcript_2393:448-1077(-)
MEKPLQKSRLFSLKDERASDFVIKEKVPLDDVGTTRAQIFKEEIPRSKQLSSWKPFSQRKLERSSSTFSTASSSTIPTTLPSSSSISHDTDNDARYKRKKVERSLSSRSVSSNRILNMHEMEPSSVALEGDIIRVAQVYGVEKPKTKRQSSAERPIAERVSEWRNSSLRSLQDETCFARSFVVSTTRSPRKSCRCLRKSQGRIKKLSVG